MLKPKQEEINVLTRKLEDLFAGLKKLDDIVKISDEWIKMN